jgi:hypothetical protein
VIKNRRKFLITASGLLTAATLPQVLAKPLKRAKDNKLSNKKTVQQGYIDKVGDSFLVRSEHGSTKLKLESVESGHQQEGLENFRLVFSSKSKKLEENTYSVTHLGSLNTKKINIIPSQSIEDRFVASFCLLS